MFKNKPNGKTILILGILLTLVFSCISKEKFDSQKWKNADTWEDLLSDKKLKMCDDLIRSEVLLNQDLDAIIELIGKTRAHSKENDSVKFFEVQRKYTFMSGIDPAELTYIKIKFNSKRISYEAELYCEKGL